MGVLIEDMEMPKKGSWVTLRVFPDGQCFLYSWCGNDFDFMEHLTAVPATPHGRLIDADAVIDLVMQYCPDDDGVCSKAGADLRELLDEIENMPTVIPAEPPKEET